MGEKAQQRAAEKATRAVPATQRALARLTGARLCFGRPVQYADRTVIVVASVRTIGGYGYGKGPLEAVLADTQAPERPGGAGGGGLLDARPVGFIEIGPDGTRFEAISDGRAALGTIAAGSAAAVTVGRVLLARRRRRRRAPAIAAPPPSPRRRLLAPSRGRR